MKVVHPLKPIYNSESKVLILGSFPSIKSRENSFYYAHPKNRFWSTLEKVFKENIGSSNQDREKFLLIHKIALFDVVYSCNITASSDSSIKDVIPNDIRKLLIIVILKRYLRLVLRHIVYIINIFLKMLG